VVVWTKVVTIEEVRVAPTDETPPGVDIRTPNIARMYDYWLGGKDNFAADRAAAEQVIAISSKPGVLRDVRENRAFLGRAVRTVAGLGIRQFLDIGAGLPTQQNVHQVAKQVNPDSRVVYVDYDPVVCTHGRALLAGDDGVAFVQADARKPRELVAGPEVTALIDFSRPVAVLLVAVLHLIRDADDPARTVAELRSMMAPGSYLILSHLSGERHPVEMAKAVEVYETATAGLIPRPRARIQEFFDGFELLEPGLTNAPSWRPEVIVPDADTFPVLAGVGHLR
jgi:S-adenosyl methyltransferase